MFFVSLSIMSVHTSCVLMKIPCLNFKGPAINRSLLYCDFVLPEILQKMKKTGNSGTAGNKQQGTDYGENNQEKMTVTAKSGE